MPSRRHIARDITYAHSAETKGGRAMIRLMENTTGRLRLIKRADGYEDEVAAGRDFWQVMLERYGLTLDVVGGSLDNIPKDRPLILKVPISPRRPDSKENSSSLARMSRI